ncbi:MAG: hypothetical protein ABSD38_13025 [Syntrophorhabdales bacterium]
MADQEYLQRVSQLPILFMGRGFDTVMAVLQVRAKEARQRRGQTLRPCLCGFRHF